MNTPPINLDPQLYERLVLLAKQNGTSLSDFASAVLSAHVDAAERQAAEYAEDDVRWQRYLETGAVVSADQVRGKLARLVSQATLR